jgi:homoserine dehydrogenase
VLDRPGVLAEVTSVFGRNDVSIQSMDQSGFGEEARLAFLTHQALSANIEATVKELVALPSVDAVGACIRVIDEAIS